MIESLGRIGDDDVQAVTLTGRSGTRAKVLTFGARLAELWVPDAKGQLADIVLGPDSLADWQAHGRYLGTTCGRFANRIAGGRFSLDGRVVELDRNEGANQLHGGSKGFDLKHWRIEDASVDHVTLTATSPAGEMGFPGTILARVTYRLADGLSIEMQATTDAPTVVNLANHAYFNLSGQGAGSVLGHELRVFAAQYTPVKADKIPTGEIRSVAGTAFDFQTPRRIGEQLPGPEGLDHNFCLSAPLQAVQGELLRPAADLRDPASGRALRLWTNEVGLQVYTGAHFDGSQPGKGGVRYHKFPGIALETQKFPDSPNQPQFPSSRLEPGQTYRHLVLLDFSPT